MRAPVLRRQYLVGRDDDLTAGHDQAHVGGGQPAVYRFSVESGTLASGLKPDSDTRPAATCIPLARK
jgi:hypothetical protein